MTFRLLFTVGAAEQLKALDSEPVRLRKVRKTLGLLETNLRHPGLHTHKFQSLSRQLGIDVFEAYVEGKTPGAYRVFWHYGPGKGSITVIAITPHP